MLTYTGRRNLFGTLSGDSGDNNLATGDALMNEFDREILTMKPWAFRQVTKTKSTVAGQQFYYWPATIGRMAAVSVTIGTTTYTPKEVKSQDEWNRINQSTSTSDTPEYYFNRGRSTGFYPTPATSTTDAITFVGEVTQKDLSMADYVTGTITSIANGATTVTGSTTVWTSKMVGCFIRITDSSTANTGDGHWYEIASVTSATVLELVSPYEGTSISGGTAAYTIGQVSVIPGDFHMLSLHRALEHYFTFVQPEEKRAANAKNLYSEGLKRLQIEHGGRGI